MKKIHLLAVAILSLLLCSCAGKTLQPADPAAAQNRWQTFTQQSNIKAAPFRDSLSMRFGKEGDTRRVTALIWGNGDKTLRLDVLAGVGAVVANIAQKDNHFFIYTPMQRKAYFHEGASSPLLKVGVPLPFDLFSLEALLNGRYTDVFGKEFVRAAQQGDSIIYTLGAGAGGELTIGPDAQLPGRMAAGSFFSPPTTQASSTGLTFPTTKEGRASLLSRNGIGRRPLARTS